ncbi:MAG TPA: GntR family transcriptional regulator [Actinomycetota bacterium]
MSVPETETATRFSAGAQPLSGLLRVEEQRRTAHEFVRDTLRRAILSGALAGGTRLVQADIAAQLNVSTTPVREALRDLAADGLIRFDPHRGGVVNTIDAAEFQEIYEIRKRLEPYAVRRAAERISAKDLDAAAALAAAMEAEPDPGAWTELNWRFHGMLVQAARSPRLLSVVKSAQDAAALYVARSLQETPSRVEQGNAEHRALLEAMRRRDGDTVERILVEHLEGTLGALKEPSQPR